MQVGERLRQVLREPRRAAGAGHGVPMVAHSARVESEGMDLIGGMGGRALTHWHQPRLAVRMSEAAVLEEPRRRRGAGEAHWPLGWLQSVIIRGGKPREAADVEEPRRSATRVPRVESIAWREGRPASRRGRDGSSRRKAG